MHIEYADRKNGKSPVEYPHPDLEPVLQAYESPTVVVTSEIMELVADEIAEAAEEIEDSKIFEEILNVIIEVQQELGADIAMVLDECQPPEPGAEVGRVTVGAPAYRRNAFQKSSQILVGSMSFCSAGTPSISRVSAMSSTLRISE